MLKRERESETNAILTILLIEIASMSAVHKIEFELSSDDHEIQSFMSYHNKSRLHYYNNVTRCHNVVSLQSVFWCFWLLLN